MEYVDAIQDAVVAYAHAFSATIDKVVPVDIVQDWDSCCLHEVVLG